MIFIGYQKYCFKHHLTDEWFMWHFSHTHFLYIPQLFSTPPDGTVQPDRAGSVLLLPVFHHQLWHQLCAVLHQWTKLQVRRLTPDNFHLNINWQYNFPGLFFSSNFCRKAVIEMFNRTRQSRLYQEPFSGGTQTGRYDLCKYTETPMVWHQLLSNERGHFLIWNPFHTEFTHPTKLLFW